MPKRFFAKFSAHGSVTSHGFVNDTIVLVFNSKKNRNDFVKNSNNLSCRPIKASEATRFASNYSLTENKHIKPNTFKGEFWGIVNYYYDESFAPGCLGALEVCSDDSNCERLLK
jgi:hypothetical protein